MNQIKGFIEVLFRVRTSPDYVFDGKLDWVDYTPVYSSFPITEFDSPMDVLDMVATERCGKSPRPLQAGDILHLYVTEPTWTRNRSVVMMLIADNSEALRSVLHPHAVVQRTESLPGLCVVNLTNTMPPYSGVHT